LGFIGCCGFFLQKNLQHPINIRFKKVLNSYFIYFTFLSYSFKPLNMTFIEQLEALERLHLLIQRKATGTPEQLAGRFNVSPRTIRNFIQILKDKDLSIHYCRDLQTYYYDSDVEVQFFSVKRLDNLSS
jgi:hypothetical protein